MKSYAVGMAVGMGLLGAAAQATVDVNTATASQMQQQLGLSRDEAVKIISTRERQPFKAPVALAQAGISPERAEQLKGKVSASSTADSTNQAPRKKRSGGKHKSARKPRKPKQTTAGGAKAVGASSSGGMSY
jgi:hypothetical protein